MYSDLTRYWNWTLSGVLLGCAVVACAANVPAATAQDAVPEGTQQGIVVPTHVRAEVAPVGSRPVLSSERYGVDIASASVVMVAGPVDVEALRAEDATMAASPMRVGVSVPVGVSLLDGDVTFQDVPGVGTIWSITVVSPGAQGLRLHMTNVDLPPGAELWMYAPSVPQAAEGPYETDGPQGTGAFWSRIFAGEEVRVEYFLPDDAGDLGFFVVEEISHIYRGLEPPEPTEGYGVRDAGDCHLDVMCYPAWHPLHNATARIFFEDNGTYLCTGTLLTTVAGDETPYFMTANHCVANDTVGATVTAYWFYQTDSCDGWIAPYEQSGNTSVLWTNGSYDISLLMFNGALPAGVTWAGWDTNSVVNNEDVACISHPSGDRKKITFGYKYSGTTYKYQIYWTDGTIEGGSSGSGVYRDSTHSYVGVASTCVVGTDCDSPEGPCQYGKLSGVYSSIQSYLQQGSDDAYEDNDSCAAAEVLAAGSYADLVLKRIDDDWYGVVVEPCEEITVTLDHRRAWGDVDIEMYNACGGDLLASDLGNDHNEKVLTYVNDSGATEMVRLHVYLGDGDADTRNTYDLDIAIADLTPPPTPTGLWATDGAQCGVIVVLWTGDASATSYSVWRSETNDSGTAVEIDSTPDMYYPDYPPADEVPYYYWVKAHKGESDCGTSGFSNSDSGYSHCEGCFGDLDGDNDIDLADLATLLGNYGTTSGATYEDGDLDGDGDVDLQDLAALLAVYGTPC